MWSGYNLLVCQSTADQTFLIFLQNSVVIDALEGVYLDKKILFIMGSPYQNCSYLASIE